MRLADCGRAMYDGATAQREALVKFETAKSAKYVRSVRRKILYRRPNARHKILKSTEIFKLARAAKIPNSRRA